MNVADEADNAAVKGVSLPMVPKDDAETQFFLSYS